MKQKVIRQVVAGALTPFVFDVKACSFLVKNFSSGDAYVSLEAGVPDSECWKLPSMIAEEFYYNENTGYYTDTIYIKADGEIEVEALGF